MNLINGKIAILNGTHIGIYLEKLFIKIFIFSSEQIEDR